MADADTIGLPTGETGMDGEGYDGLDTAHLRQVFPPETWSAITNQLQKRSTKATENLANSSEYFRNSLASQRTTYLFQKVLPLVTASVWKKEGLEGLPLSDVLKCRGVSKHWNAAIDKLIPEKFQFFGEGSNDKRVTDVGNAFKSILSNNGSVQNFLSHFEATHPAIQLESIGRNPWIWGNISVDISKVSAVDMLSFLQANKTMLSKYGGHLRSFSVFTHEFQFYWIFWHVYSLRQWLEWMPNLAKFRYKSQTAWRLSRKCEEFNLSGAVRGVIMPKLRFLESMHIDNMPVALLNQLVEQNNHVTELVLDDSVDNWYDILAFDTPNLKRFEMKDNKGDLVQKLGYPQINWNLESLKLGFRRPVVVNGAALFQVTQSKFAQTLVSLRLEMEVWRGGPSGQDVWQDCKSCRLDLPMLRNFWMDMNTNPVCLDFLLPMRHNLEEISVSFGYSVPFPPNIVETSGTIVQYYGFEEKMLESNIWVIFKKLKKFEVMGSRDLGKESICYLREDWVRDNVYA